MGVLVADVRHLQTVGSGYTQTVLPLWTTLVSLCAGRLLKDAIWAALGGGALKPEADSMFSLNSVLLAQAVTATKDGEIDQDGFTTISLRAPCR